jgi:prolyl 4-hydroxylase
MSRRQPQSMQNYTEMGFKKIRAPPEVFALIQSFWAKNKDKGKVEQWGTANTYTNNWESPSYMVSVEDSSLRGGGYRLKNQIWNSARQTIQEWTGQELTQCSLYGIRIYKTGAILATHVDRLPLVSSAIINVDQDVDEPWPLEVYGHDGKAYNVTMEPGDMVLYESHSVLHGRPFPLKGRYMANIFIHFEPTGHSLRHSLAHEHEDVNVKYKRDLERGVGGHEVDAASGLPPYILPGSPEAPNWKRQHPGGVQTESKKKPAAFTTGSTLAHQYAQEGSIEDLKMVLAKDKSMVHAKDKNGWSPLHEGIRNGRLEVVKLLVEHGADVNAKTNSGQSSLSLAKEIHGEDGPLIEFLESLGAIEAGPDL